MLTYYDDPATHGPLLGLAIPIAIIPTGARLVVDVPLPGRKALPLGPRGFDGLLVLDVPLPGREALPVRPRGFDGLQVLELAGNLASWATHRIASIAAAAVARTGNTTAPIRVLDLIKPSTSSHSQDGNAHCTGCWGAIAAQVSEP